MASETEQPPHDRILSAVLHLLEEGGIDAVSTRAVGEAAHVQAPAIYRLFGDKQGLLEAAVERGYREWVAEKGARQPIEDPVEALRAGWDEAIEFGLDHPAMYRIAFARSTRSPALGEGQAVLREKIRRAAAAGRLRVSEDQAVALMQAAGRGVTLALLDEPSGSPTAAGLADAAREAVIAAITTGEAPAHDGTLRSTAAALQALLPEAEALQPNERALMSDWLDRIAAGRPRTA